MRIDVLTLFPAPLGQMLAFGVTGRALQRELIDLRCWNPRDYSGDERGTVDDRPFGGGPGMVMLVEPLRRALAAARADQAGGPVVYLSPQGRRLNQTRVRQLAALPQLLVLCGRYEGVDERIMDQVDEEYSIGDYVLSGGELAAAVLVDAMARLQPGALGKDASAEHDSFMDGLLDCPHYTRPEQVDGQAVPPVLLSGNHAVIERWRRYQSLGRTWLRRPDLLAARTLDDEERALLQQFIEDYFAREHDKAHGQGSR